MTTDEFWELIARTKAEVGDDDDPEAERQAQLLEEHLVEQPPDDIIDFDRIFHERMQEADDWKLWGAAYIINGGCSDDGFEYFRGWLIAQGQDVFTTAVRDPETLGKIVDPERSDYEGEFMLYVATGAYETKTGAEITHVDLPHTETKGERWSEDDLVPMLPRLAALYGWD